MIGPISVNPGELLSLLQMALFFSCTFVLRCMTDFVDRRLPSLYDCGDIALPAFAYRLLPRTAHVRNGRKTW